MGCSGGAAMSNYDKLVSELNHLFEEMSAGKPPQVREQLMKGKDDLIKQLSAKKNELNALDEKKFNEHLEQAKSGFKMMANMMK